MPEKEWKYANVDLSTDITTITAVPCLVKCAVVTSVTSAHVVLVKDATNQVFALPASSAAGYTIDVFGVRFESSLIVDPDNAGTGKVSIYYRLLREP